MNATKQLKNLEKRMHKIFELQAQLETEPVFDRQENLRDMIDFQCDNFQNEFNEYRVRV